MHIKAYVAACEIDELDRNAKDALRAVCGRMTYPEAVAEVPAWRIASDMKVAVITARRALRRVVDGGWLSVDNKAGQRPKYIATPALLARTPPARDDAEPCAPGEHTEAFRLSQALAAPPPPSTRAGGAAGENGSSPPVARHPPSCVCGGSGWLEVAEGRQLAVARCPGLEKGTRR